MSLQDKQAFFNGKCTKYLCFLLGLLLTISGVVLCLFWPQIFDSILSRHLRLAPNSETYKVWKKTSITLYLDFYFFNWTNPEDINDQNILPQFEQVGPYRFKEDKEKVNIVWNDNGTVTFQQKRHWYFVPEDSNGSLDDEIATVNVVALTAAYQTRYWSYILQKGVSISLATMVREVHVVRTIGELLFEGYPDKLIDMARHFPAMDGVFIPPVDRFGWFYERNGSVVQDGVFNMETGENDPASFGKLKNWNYGARTNYFGDHCGMVNGSAGEFWPMNSQKDHITLFSPDLCRSIKFDYDREETVHGISGYKYSGGDSIMDNGTLYPENKCFCNGECVPSGAVNVSSCRYGAPAFVSFPHFYKADPYYSRLIEGMQPDEKKHSFHIILEPKTSVPLDVAARFQINILLSPSKHISLYQNVREAFMPVLWFEQRATISDEMAADFHKVLQIPWIGMYAMGAIAVIGMTILCFLLTCHYYVYIAQRRRTDDIIKRWGQGGTHRPLTQQTTTHSNDKDCNKNTTVVYTP